MLRPARVAGNVKVTQQMKLTAMIDHLQAFQRLDAAYGGFACYCCTKEHCADAGACLRLMRQTMSFDGYNDPVEAAAWKGGIIDPAEARREREKSYFADVAPDPDHAAAQRWQTYTAQRLHHEKEWW